MCLFGSQISERLGVHGLATLSMQRAGAARVSHMETPVVAAQSAVIDETETEFGTEIIEELLVEEISIDGMCGVY
ncbi:hypothetical protein BH10ACT2_BH10ACT2_26060 [soil metagenome]